ncbi:MAG: pyridoxal phosphate-dependent aminotransferase [Erysipelotrichaceae bacterium]|nr:pyridoxal phosphate-dependent aminotransferase [Erysipelotrichaceae bacterium]
MENFDQVISRENTSCVKWDGWKNMNKPEGLLPLWVADMDFQAPDAVIEAISKKAAHGIFGYGFCDHEYYGAVSSWMNKRHNLIIAQENVVTTPGVIAALNIAVNTFSQINDAIMINKPVYYPFDQVVEQNGRKKVECPMIFKDGHYLMDFSLFEQKIINHKVKIFILCNPYNPIGKVWTRAELKKIGEICLKHEVLVISDEIHMDFVFKNHVHIPFVNVDKRFKDICVIATSPSKTFNLAGLQCANILFFNDDLKERFVATKRKSGFTDEPNIMAIEATKAAYLHGKKWLDDLIGYVEKNKSCLRTFLAKHIPEVKLVEPEGLYLAWVDFTGLDMDHEQLEAFMINEAKLWLDEGYIFGIGGAGFERINLAVPQSVLKEALCRLNLAIKNRNPHESTPN